MLAVHSANVLHELYDGEVIVVNMENGCYYSIQGSGCLVWEGIVEGAEPQTIIKVVQAHYAGDEEAIVHAVYEFLMQLQVEKLAATVDGTGTFAPPAPETKQPFSPPKLEKYTDMEDLFLLDPVHEVDETGWPQQASPEQIESTTD